MTWNLSLLRMFTLLISNVIYICISFLFVSEASVFFQCMFNCMYANNFCSLSVCA